MCNQRTKTVFQEITNAPREKGFPFLEKQFSHVLHLTSLSPFGTMVLASGSRELNVSCFSYIVTVGGIHVSGSDAFLGQQNFICPTESVLRLSTLPFYHAVHIRIVHAHD